jgi:hypothetical protein
MTEELGQQIAELTGVHKGLATVTDGTAGTIVSGALPFEASADNLEVISESFDIELTIPKEFPALLPTVRETAGRIGPDYGHRNSNGTLCLAVPVEQRRAFLDEPTLLGYVNRLVIPFLYGFCFFQKYGRHPFSEAEHGNEGILRHYMDTLDLKDEVLALVVICFLIENGYRGHHECPCGSGQIVRACHGPKLLALHRTHDEQSIRSDFVAIFDLCLSKFKSGQLSLSAPLRRQVLRIIRRLDKHQRRTSK